MSQSNFHAQLPARETILNSLKRHLENPRFGIHVDLPTLKSLLLDDYSSPEAGVLVAGIIQAGEQNIREELKRPYVDWEKRLDRLVTELSQKSSLDPSQARWAVEAWAYGLGLIRYSQVSNHLKTVAVTTSDTPVVSSNEAPKGAGMLDDRKNYGILGLAAALGLVLLIGLVYGVITLIHSTPSTTSQASSTTTAPTNEIHHGWGLPPVDHWTVGSHSAEERVWSEPTHVPWLASWFVLPNREAVRKFIESYGVVVGDVVPVNFVETKTERTITYQVNALYPHPLFQLTSTVWHSNDPLVQQLAAYLRLSRDLPYGKVWQAEKKTLYKAAGQHTSFLWNLHQDREFDVVTADRLPLPAGVYTTEEVAHDQHLADAQISALLLEVQQIRDGVAAYRNDLLAQIPPNPPTPNYRSAKFGGSGSGEPTRSGVRILGGTATGAAIGGLAAGGDGAGIGAAAGFLGGLVYDTVSKANDKKKLEEEVDAANAQLRADYNAQVNALEARRAEARKQAAAREQSLIDALNVRIHQHDGYLIDPKSV